MNYDLNLLALASLVNLGGCVLQEPIGSTPDGNSSSGGTSSGETSKAEDSTAGSSSTSAGTTFGDDSSSSEDTSDSSGGTSAGEGACALDSQENFTWQWDFGAHEPTFDPEAGGYDSDAPALIDCESNMYLGDPEADTLELDLACSVDGVPIESQGLSLSPIPAGVLESLEQGELLSVAFRPEQQCPNGCFVSDRNGWLAIRRGADETLLLGIVDAGLLLEPVDELAPLEISTASSSCEPVADGLECDPPGWSAPLELTVADGGASTVVVGAGTAALGDYEVVVNSALEGEWDGCTFDAGYRSHVGLLILRP